MAPDVKIKKEKKTKNNKKPEACSALAAATLEPEASETCEQAHLAFSQSTASHPVSHSISLS